MGTPHINANDHDFAPTVLMPGDPLRAEYIAETYLADVRQVTSVRNMLGYTGTYKGKSVSVMGHGMGIPSCSIYTYELIKEYSVRNIIRVGSCGAISSQVKVRDIIIAMGACTDSKVNRSRYMGHDFAAIADFGLLELAVIKARLLGLPFRVGNVHSSDLFYGPQSEQFDVMEHMGILGVEMETAGIYGVAAELGAKALTILTVSDHIRNGEKLSAEERQLSFNDMIQTGLEISLDLN